jgi:hypothetical protein
MTVLLEQIFQATRCVFLSTCPGDRRLFPTQNILVSASHHPIFINRNLKEPRPKHPSAAIQPVSRARAVPEPAAAPPGYSPARLPVASTPGPRSERGQSAILDNRHPRSGFSENGSLAPMQIQSDSQDSLRSDVGFRLFYQWQIGRSCSSPPSCRDRRGQGQLLRKWQCQISEASRFVLW